MKLRKRIAAIGAAVMMATSMMSINASAVYKYRDDSNCKICAYTSFTSQKASAEGWVNNKGKKATYQIRTSVYWKTTGGKTSSYSNDLWKSSSLSKGKTLKAYSSDTARCYGYKYSSRVQVIRNNSNYPVVQSDYA